MGLTNFPNGITSFGMPVLGSGGLMVARGTAFFVSSVQANRADEPNQGGSPDLPFATLDFAIGQCTANRGDVIFLMENHAETITTDAGVALDVAGVTVFGLGQGEDRPTFTVQSATAANMSVTAANVRIHNVLFLSNLATLVNILEIAGDHCEVSHCEFRETTLSALVCILIGLADGDADYCHIHNCKFYWNEPAETNTGNAAIEIALDSDHITIEDNDIIGDFDEAGIDVLAGGNACDFLTIRRNYIQNDAAGQHAVQIESAGTMNGLRVYDNVFIADVPSTTSALHTALIWGNTAPLSPTAGPRHFWVDSNGGGADAGEGTADHPYITLDFAIGQCTASHGDIINVAAGHNEAMTAADDVDADVAGIHIIGHGVGSAKPTFDYDGANGEFVIGAAGVLVENLRFRSSVTVVVNAINIEAAGDDFVIRKCDFIDEGDAGGTDEFNDAIIVEAGANRGIIEDCYFDARAAAAVSAIELNGAVLGIIIRNNTIIGDYSTANIRGDATLSEEVLIENNTLWNGVTSGLNAFPCISLLTGTVGIIRHNTLSCNVERVAASIVADGCFLHDNTYTESANAFVGIRSTSELGGWRCAHTAVTTAMSANFNQGAITIFTVTGDVMVMAAWFVAATAVSSDSNTGTWALGTTGSTSLLCAQTTVGDGTFLQHDVWSNGTSVPEGVVIESADAYPFLISGDSTNIILTVATNDTAGGTGDFYCMWMPASSDGAVTGSTI